MHFLCLTLIFFGHYHRFEPFENNILINPCIKENSNEYKTTYRNHDNFCLNNT